MMIRSDALAKSGGDTVQMLQYKRVLEDLGIHVDVCAGTRADFSSYDLVHLFNIDRPLETLAQMTRAKTAGKPVVLSPVHQARRFVEAYERREGQYLDRIVRAIPIGFRERGKDLARVVRGNADFAAWWALARLGGIRAKRRILGSVDAAMLLARAEGEEIVRDFGVLPRRAYVVYNGCNAGRITPGAREQADRLLGQLSEFVLSVGRIERGKNQLGLLNCLAETGLPLVFVGRVNPWHRVYAGRFFRQVEKYPHVHYLGWIDPDVMPEIYARARVHVLASWFEACPLVDLEAACYGCRVVTTTRSYAREYAREFAVFCEPEDGDGIRRAVLDSFKSGRSMGMARAVAERFSWERAGTALLRAYDEILADGRA